MKVRTFCLVAAGAFSLVALGMYAGRGHTGPAGVADVRDLPQVQLPAGVPAKVGSVLKHVDQHGTAPPGFVGGRVFTNDGRNDEQVLPRADPDGEPITYHEYDVNRRVPHQNRGAERLVIGTDGSAYYTGDHYRTFIRIR